MKKIEFSLIIPVYNEEKILEKNILSLYSYLKSLKVIKRFEIIAVDNGSIDETLNILECLTLRYQEIKFRRLKKRGLGRAFKAGILKARYRTIMFLGIDISFGLDSIKKSIDKYSEGFAIVLASKGHIESVYEAPFLRKFISKVSNFLIRKLFGVKVYDTQGSSLIDGKLVKTYINNLDSTGPWFQSQLVIYGNALDAKIVEIPVKYISGNRKSKIKFKDVFNSFSDLIKEYPRYRRWRKKIRDKR